MNIKLYFAGFFVCFSSFGMNDVSNIRDEVSRIANLMNERKFIEASNSLKRHLSDKPLIFDAVLKNSKQTHTLLSYYIYFVKDKMDSIKTEDEDCVGHLGYLLLSGSKNQLDEGQYIPDYYLQKNDKRIREMIISLVANKRFKWAEVFLAKGSDICCLDYNETFMYDLGDGLKEYTFCSLYMSVLKYAMERISYDTVGLVVPSIFIKSYSCQLIGGQYEKDCYIKKNDPRIIDIGLYAIDRKLFHLADEFFDSCDRYVHLYDIMECEDISHAVISFYYMYCVKQIDNDLYLRFRDRAQQVLSQANLTRTYKTKMLEMISYLEEKKYRRLANLFLTEYFANKCLYELGIEYDILSYYQYILNRTAHYDLTSTKMLEMISYLKEKEYHMLDSVFLKEYFLNERLQTPGTERNILSCYQYVLNQMEIRENVDAGLQPIAKPKVTPTELKDIMIFLEGNKYHSITNALFSVYGRNKVLDANVVFMYDMGCGEKACTPVALSMFYALKEREERKEANKFAAEWMYLTKYLVDNVYLMAGFDPILNQCIANTQGSRQQSLISLKENINQYALGHRYCEHLHNEMLQLRKKIKQQIHNEYVLCVDIMNWMLYYQE